MKKLIIYRRDENNLNQVLRTIRVTADFIGIGKKGQINNEEFKKLALDLEPTATSHEVI
jgi:hypothetical protein